MHTRHYALPPRLLRESEAISAGVAAPHPLLRFYRWQLKPEPAHVIEAHPKPPRGVPLSGRTVDYLDIVEVERVLAAPPPTAYRPRLPRSEANEWSFARGERMPDRALKDANVPGPQTYTLRRSAIDKKPRAAFIRQ